MPFLCQIVSPTKVTSIDMCGPGTKWPGTKWFLVERFGLICMYWNKMAFVTKRQGMKWFYWECFGTEWPLGRNGQVQNTFGTKQPEYKMDPLFLNYERNGH